MSNTIILDPNGRPADASRDIVHADASGNITHDPVANEEVQLVPFKNGLLLMHGPHPVKKGMSVIRTGNGAVVAMTLNTSVADFICQAAAMFIQFARAEQQRVEQAQAAQKLAEGFDAEAAAASVISGEQSPACDPVQNPAISGATIG